MSIFLLYRRQVFALLMKIAMRERSSVFMLECERSLCILSYDLTIGPRDLYIFMNPPFHRIAMLCRNGAPKYPKHAFNSIHLLLRYVVPCVCACSPLGGGTLMYLVVLCSLKPGCGPGIL